jgi:hypothetical protein
MKKLTNEQWWNELAPYETCVLLELPQNTTRAAVWLHLLEVVTQTKNAQKSSVEFRVRYDDTQNKPLLEILEHCRVFLLPEQREFLETNRCLGRLKGFRPQTKDQQEARQRVTDDLLARIMRKDLDEKPKTVAETLAVYEWHELLQTGLQKLAAERNISARLREAAVELLAILEQEQHAKVN